MSIIDRTYTVHLQKFDFFEKSNFSTGIRVRHLQKMNELREVTVTGHDCVGCEPTPGQ